MPASPRRMVLFLVPFALLALILGLAIPQNGCAMVSADSAEDVQAKAEESVEEAKQGLKERVGMTHDSGSSDSTEDSDSSSSDSSDEIFGSLHEVEVLTEADFEHKTQVATGATTGDWFVEFYAPWCGHCRKLQPVWDELADKLGGQVNVGKVDVTKNKGLGKRFGIKSFPTLLLFSHGKVYKFSGGRKLENLMNFATGGFKETDSTAVPGPVTFSGGVTSVLSKVLTDLKGIKDGKMPSSSTLMLLAIGGMSFALVVALVMPSKKSGRTKVE